MMQIKLFNQMPIMHEDKQGVVFINASSLIGSLSHEQSYILQTTNLLHDISLYENQRATRYHDLLSFYVKNQMLQAAELLFVEFLENKSLHHNQNELFETNIYYLMIILYIKAEYWSDVSSLFERILYSGLNTWNYNYFLNTYINKPQLRQQAIEIFEKITIRQEEETLARFNQAYSQQQWFKVALLFEDLPSCYKTDKMTNNLQLIYISNGMLQQAVQLMPNKQIKYYNNLMILCMQNCEIDRDGP